MNVKLKNCPTVLNKSKISKLRSDTKQNNKSVSITKPVVRRLSQDSDNIKKYAFQRRTYSLQDKASIMTTNTNDIIPEKENFEMDENVSSKESTYLTRMSSTDSLENGKSSTYPRSNNLENDINSKDNMEHTGEVTTLGNIDEIPKKLDLNSKQKLNLNKKPVSPGNTNNTTTNKDKAEKPVVERKPLDPKTMFEEMRRYYENEIFVLKKQLQQVGSNVPPNEEALQKRCHMLESQLRKSQNDTESLAEQVGGLKIQLQTWPNKVTELEEDNESLRGRIEDVRAINSQRQNEIDELHEIVKNLETKLWEQSSGNQQQEKIFLQRLMQEYDHLLKDYELLKLNYMTNERKCYESRGIANELTGKITELENKIRKVENENNFLKRRLNSEKSFITSSFRGWARPTYPPRLAGFEQEVSPRNGSSQELLSYQVEPQPQFDMGMMSMSCYGALPSYSGSSETREQISENIRRFEPLKTKINDRYNQGKMNQSMYVQPSDEHNEVITPTSERRRVGIKEDKPFSKQFKMESSSFDMLNQATDLQKNQQMNTSLSDFRQGEPPQGSNRKKKPEYFNHDSWDNKRGEDDMNLERRYDQLQIEKKQLMTKLSHIPSSSTSRNRRSNREQRENLETQLDQIDRQLGLMRITLKQKNILK